MKKFEFVFRKIVKQRGIRILTTFFLAVFPSHSLKVFAQLLMLSSILPHDMERGDDEVILQYPLRRLELFFFEFLTGSLFMIVAEFLSISLLKSHLGIHWKFFIFSRNISTLPYIYGICMLSAMYLKSSFIVPFILLIVDGLFCETAWRYISPVNAQTIWGFLIGLGIFTLAFGLYANPMRERGEVE